MVFFAPPSVWDSHLGASVIYLCCFSIKMSHIWLQGRKQLSVLINENKVFIWLWQESLSSGLPDRLSSDLLLLSVCLFFWKTDTTEWERWGEELRRGRGSWGGERRRKETIHYRGIRMNRLQAVNKCQQGNSHI